MKQLTITIIFSLVFLSFASEALAKVQNPKQVNHRKSKVTKIAKKTSFSPKRLRKVELHFTDEDTRRPEMEVGEPPSQELEDAARDHMRRPTSIDPGIASLEEERQALPQVTVY